MSRLYFLFGACLPFYVVGAEVSNGIWASPSIFIGVVIAAISTITRGATVRLALLLIMILIFAMTSIVRHAPESYFPSLLMLFLIMAPMCLLRIGCIQKKALQTGFLWGLFATLALVWMEISTQIIGAQSLYKMIGDLFIPVEMRLSIHNYFVLYYRPHAAFMEPAHLAIYLVMALFVLDIIGTGTANILHKLTLLTLLLVGSLVGYTLLAYYLLLNALGMNSRFSRVTTVTLKRVGFSVTAFILSVAILAVTWPNEFLTILEKLVGRSMIAIEVIREGKLEGSEASRLNTMLVLFDFWKSEGFEGFFTGVGYGNISHWLTQNYNHLNSWASVSRGSVDSIIVALFIGAGFFGAMIYLVFVAVCLRQIGQHRWLSIFTFFLLLNFATGFLIWYQIWHLFAVLILLSSDQYAHFGSAKIHTEINRNMDADIIPDNVAADVR